MKRCVLMAGLALLAGVAQAQRYTALSPDVQYRLCGVGASRSRVAEGCYVRLLLVAKTQQGREVLRENCWVMMGEEVKKGSLAGGLTLLSQGDSAELVMPARLLWAGLLNHPRARGVAGKELLSVHVRVQRVVERDIILDDDYGKFYADYSAYERGAIMGYQQHHHAFRQVGDIWKHQLHAGNGKRTVKYGDAMMIAYSGKFLNGAPCDAGATAAAPFRYVRGQQWQMVQGLSVALASMSEGEKATFIIPSKMAFGARGLADIVPPFTPVVYEVEVVKVNIK